jgi:malate synthase
VPAGTRFDERLFQKVYQAHDEWTAAFFAEQDRRGEPRRFDRSKAGVIMELLSRQLRSPRYIQHSARVLFVVAEADAAFRAQAFAAIFDLTREEVVARIAAGALEGRALAAHDQVHDTGRAG